MLVIQNGRVLDPRSQLDVCCDVAIEGDRIVHIADTIDTKGCEVLDASGLVVAPGLVDVHVHFREPGQTHKEDIHTGAQSAAAGGFTSVVMMANTSPTISTKETLETVLTAASQEMIHLYSVATITENFDGQTLTDFAALKEAGAVAFSDDGIPLTDAGVVRKAMQSARTHDFLLSLHEEDPALNGILGINEGIANQHFHVCGATGVAEYSMIARDVMLAYETGARVHIQHVSKAESIKVIEFAQALGARVSAEVSPQHFSKTEDLLLTKGSDAKMNPPLRFERDRQAMIEGLQTGVISVIATDHAPHHPFEKSVADITQAPSGMTGLETALSLGLTYLVAEGHLTLNQLLEKMTINPAQLYGLNAGYLKEGGPADLVIFDPNAERLISNQFASKSQNSPVINERLKGRIAYTIAKGQIVYQNG